MKDTEPDNKTSNDEQQEYCPGYWNCDGPWSEIDDVAILDWGYDWDDLELENISIQDEDELCINEWSDPLEWYDEEYSLDNELFCGTDPLEICDPITHERCDDPWDDDDPWGKEAFFLDEEDHTDEIDNKSFEKNNPQILDVIHNDEFKKNLRTKLTNRSLTLEDLKNQKFSCNKKEIEYREYLFEIITYHEVRNSNLYEEYNSEVWREALSYYANKYIGLIIYSIYWNFKKYLPKIINNKKNQIELTNQFNVAYDTLLFEIQRYIGEQKDKEQWSEQGKTFCNSALKSIRTSITDSVLNIEPSQKLRGQDWKRYSLFLQYNKSEKYRGHTTIEEMCDKVRNDARKRIAENNGIPENKVTEKQIDQNTAYFNIKNLNKTRKKVISKVPLSKDKEFPEDAINPNIARQFESPETYIIKKEMAVLLYKELMLLPKCIKCLSHLDKKRGNLIPFTKDEKIIMCCGCNFQQKDVRRALKKNISQAAISKKETSIKNKIRNYYYEILQRQGYTKNEIKTACFWNLFDMVILPDNTFNFYNDLKKYYLYKILKKTQKEK